MEKKLDQRDAWLIHRLQDVFVGTDFQYIPAHNQFRKTNANGFQNMIYSITNYEDLSIADVFIGVRNEAIERLVQPFVNNISGFAAHSNTIVTSIRNFQSTEQGRFKIYTPKDATLIIEQCTNFLNENGFELLEQLTQMTVLNEVLNDILKKD